MFNLRKTSSYTIFECPSNYSVLHIHVYHMTIVSLFYFCTGGKYKGNGFMLIIFKYRFNIPSVCIN